MIDLQPFCSTGPNRHTLLSPFRDGEFTYATDGRVIVRVSASEYPSESRPDTPKTLAGLGPWNGRDDKWQAIPDLPRPATEPCDECGGSGKTPPFDKCTECGGSGQVTCDYDHEHDCPKCDGRGRITRPLPIRKTPGANSLATPVACEECSGSGVLDVPTPIDIGFAYAADTLLRRLSQLPNIEICAVGTRTECIPFRFTGGVGLLMPMRRPSDTL